MRHAHRGLAQGDPISPLLFNLATHKLGKSVKEVQMCQYADDFVLFTRDKDTEHSKTNIQKALHIILTLLEELGLNISISKTKYCIFNRGYKIHNIRLKLNNELIQYEDSYKYLGLRLDKALRWGKHIDEIVEKCQKYLNLLKVLAGSGWGLHPKHLRRIFIAVIRSRMDYCSYFYDNAAHTHLRKLEVIQNQALRIIGGFIKSTPIHTMESELCVVPLQVRRAFLAFKFCLKSQSRENNRVIEMLGVLSALCERSYWRNKKIPLLVTAFNKTKEDVVEKSAILNMFSLKTWPSNIDLSDIVSLSLDSVQDTKENLDITVMKYAVSAELRFKYNTWFFLYTDGSKSSEGGGASFYDPNNPNDLNCFKTSSNLCIMSIELIAIYKALIYAESLGVQQCIVCTDSKSALQHLISCVNGHTGIPLAYSILSLIYELMISNIKIKLQWVPAHIGLRGNEEADIRAKKGITEGIPMDVLPNFSELLPKYRRICSDMWNEYFDLRSRTKGIWYRTIQCQPPRTSWVCTTRLCRKAIVTGLRLRTGHVPLNKFAALMNKVPSPNCMTCGVIEDVQHLVAECVQYEEERKELLRDLGVNLNDVGAFLTVLASPCSEQAEKLFFFCFQAMRFRLSLVGGVSV